MEQALIDRYRCPESFVKFDLIGRLSKESGLLPVRAGYDLLRAFCVRLSGGSGRWCPL